MSRNKEKAQSALNRFHKEALKDAGALETDPSQRPKYVQSVKSLPQAQKWRSIVITEISTRLTKIQDVMLDHVQIRDLNEELNKLLREKRAWEHHIKSLGGPDFLRSGPHFESTGLMDTNGTGYRYFGRAKELPEVEYLLKEDEQVKEEESQRKAVNELEKTFSQLDPTYFSKFKTSEPDVKEELYGALNMKYESTFNDIADKDLQDVSNQLLKEIKNSKKRSSDKNSAQNILACQTPLPTPDEIKLWVLDKKKEKLLAKLSHPN